MKNLRWLKIIICFISPIFSFLGITLFNMPVEIKRLIAISVLLFISACCGASYHKYREKKSFSEESKRLEKIISELDDELDDQSPEIKVEEKYDYVNQLNEKYSKEIKELREYIITAIIVFGIFYIPREPMITLIDKIYEVVMAPFEELSGEYEIPTIVVESVPLLESGLTPSSTPEAPLDPTPESEMAPTTMPELMSDLLPSSESDLPINPKHEPEPAQASGGLLKESEPEVETSAEPEQVPTLAPTSESTLEPESTLDPESILEPESTSDSESTLVPNSTLEPKSESSLSSTPELTPMPELELSLLEETASESAVLSNMIDDDEYIKFKLMYPNGYPQIEDDEFNTLYSLIFYSDESNLNERIKSDIAIWRNSCAVNMSSNNVLTSQGRNVDYYTKIEESFSNDNGRLLSSELLDEVIKGKEELMDLCPNESLAWDIAKHYKTYALNYFYQSEDARSILYLSMKSIYNAQESIKFEMDSESKEERIEYIKSEYRNIAECEIFDNEVRMKAYEISTDIDEALDESK